MPEVQLASPAVMEKLAALDERYPEIIRLCARESAKVERRLWAQQEAESESDLRAAGIEVTELDEEEKARFRAAVQRCMIGLPRGRIDRPHPAGISSTAKPGEDGQRNQENRIKNRQSAVCSGPKRGGHPALCFSIEYRNVSIY